MKRLSIMLIIMLLFAVTKAQVGLNSDGSPPEPSAILDVKSSNRGFLPPRMTQGEILNIASPAEGLMVYNKSLKTIVFFDGTSWKKTDGKEMSIELLGDQYLDGRIFYIFKVGDPGYIEGEIHGLIAATTDQSSGAVWGCSGIDINGAESTVLGGGFANTAAILAGCSTEGIAAQLCRALGDEWYLPSTEELIQLYLNREFVGGFTDSPYWTSTEDQNPGYPGQLAFALNFTDGGLVGGLNKTNNLLRVRAIRAF